MRFLQNLSHKAGLNHLPSLFTIPSDEMMAFTVGSGDNAAIAVSMGLMRRLSWQEQTAVLADGPAHAAIILAKNASAGKRTDSTPAANS